MIMSKEADLGRTDIVRTILLNASSEGDIYTVNYIIRNGANPNSFDNDGYSPLHIASREGHLDVIECLVNAGGDVNKPAIDGDLPLHAASRGGNLDIITYLITKGANIETRNNFGWTVFHFAADKGHLESLEYFLRNNTCSTSGNGHIGLGVGFKTLTGVTPLMAAARGGHLDCVRLLLENNANIETEDAEGWTAVHYAASSGNETMKNLLDRKAIMSTRLSRRGQLPISVALSSGKADTARVLLDKDATSIHHIDSAGLTLIHLATVSGLSSLIEELVSLGAGLNPQSHDGQTPLHVAIRLCRCMKRDVEVTTALQQIQQESDDDLSPAEALIQFLINQGSKVDIKDNEGFTPVQYTRDERVRQMVLRSLSEDSVHEFRDLPIARSSEINRIIGCEGGILHLDSCDVTISIPPRTVQAGSCHDVSIVLVTDDPPPIREGEFLTGHGIGITFPVQRYYSTCKPVTLTMPHAATVVKSSAVHTDIIWKHTESASAHRDRFRDDGCTQCILKKRDVKFVIDPSSVIQDKVQLWIPIKLHDHVLGKRMVCTPFLPVDMAQGEDIALRIYIHEDIPYIVQKIQEEEENLLYHQVHPGRCFGLEPEPSDLELECNGTRRIISAKDLFNRQETLVSMPIKAETNAKTQMINISISATSTNQPKTSMTFVAIRTGFSADIRSTLDEMVPGSNVDLRNAEHFPSEEFITKEINTDKYYHLGLALGLSYQTLDSIQFRSRLHEEAGVYTPNQKAVIFMIRYWKCLQHSVSLANDHLREVWKSVSDSGDSAPVLKQRQSVEKQHDTNVEEVFEGEFPRKEPKTTPTVGLLDLEVEIPEARGRWEERLRHKRTNTPSVRSDSLSSFSTVLEEEEGRFSQHYLGKFFKPLSFEMSFDNFFRFDASMSAMTLPPVAHLCSASSQLRIDEHREDEEVEHSKQAVLEWMKSGEGVKTADVRPHEYTTQPTDEEGQIIESAHHMSPPSAHQDEIPIENLESREDLSDGTVMIRLEKHGIEVRIPPNEAYRAKDVIVEPIHDIPPELVLKETEAIISVGLRMSPSDATFDIPVTVTMPHCGIFTKPETAKVVTYYRKSASESFTALLSTGGSPQCVVRHRDLDIYMNHFSEIWIVAIIRRTFIGKRVICTPYIPVSAPKNDEHVLFVHVRDENIGKGEVQPGYMAPITGEQFLVRWRSGALKITCPESTMKDKAMTLRGSELRHLTQQKVMFKVDTRTADKNKVILQFILKQSTTKQLLVPMHLEEITASPRPSASTSVDIPPQDATTSAGKVSTSKARPTKESREQDFDDFLKKVAKQTDKDTDIDSLGKELGFEPAEITRYIQTNEKYHTVTYMGTLNMLRDWRNMTTESKEREELKKALIASNHHRLADNLLNDDMAKS